jgi:hypothetical protein
MKQFEVSNKRNISRFKSVMIKILFFLFAFERLCHLA